MDCGGLETSNCEAVAVAPVTVRREAEVEATWKQRHRPL